jgi:hypothetical protein
MPSIKISCSIAPINGSIPVGAEVWVNDQQILDVNYVTETIDINQYVNSLSEKNVLTYVMKNKTPHHTRIDANNNIIEDSCLIISNLVIDDFEVGQQLQDLSIYTHNHNGTSNQVQVQFYEVMGCNGTVRMEFYVPVYEWLVNQYKVCLGK